jgi:LysM repeat protein
MKILKIFGLVVGIHVFALIFIFASPGCSSTTKTTPVPTDTTARSEPSPAFNVPNTGASSTNSAGTYSPPIPFNPDAPATAAPGGGSASSGGVRFTPTRPSSPAAGNLVAEPVTDVTPATTHTVQSGDSLWTLARKHHITVAELSAANNLKANAVLKQGQKLIIPGKPASATAAATANPAASGGATAKTVAPVTTPGPKPPTDAVKHVVKSGETLGSIAKQYGVRAGEIATANAITDPAKIKAGDTLVIPGWQTPVSKSGKSATKSGADASKSASPALPPPLTNDPASKAPANEVPVIRVDEAPSPFAPAPKK